MTNSNAIVILDGARRTPRADILIDNKKPGLFSRFTATQLGGMAIRATLDNTPIDKRLIGHVVMGMAQHSHRDSIYGAQGMRWRGGLGTDVPALTVARICGSGAEAVAVGTEMILAGVRHDEARPFSVVGGGESMQYPFCLFNYRGRPVGATVQKFGPIDVNLEEGKTYFVCTCGRSGKQPFCYGSHKDTEFKSHSFMAEIRGNVWLCMCKHTNKRPFCDGTHSKICNS